MDNTLQKAAEVRTLDAAVIVTAGGVFAEASLPHDGYDDVISPLTRVGGLSLFQRTVLTLQRAGIKHLFILTGQEEEALRRGLSHDRRVTAAVHWMPDREFPPDDFRTWEALVTEMQGACLVVGVQAVFSCGFVEHLRDEVLKALSVLIVGDQEQQSPPQATRFGMVVLPAHLLRGSEGFRLGAASREAPPLRAIVEQASSDGCLRQVPAMLHPSQWYQPIRGYGDVRRTETLLLQSPKGPYEGFIDTHFNRKVSSLLTRVFLKAGWSANSITILSICVGFVAAGFFAHGSYLTGVLGALFFQLSAIVDCCDGDVARMTFSESRFGEQLDILGDNAVHMAIFAGVAWAGYQQGAGMVSLALGAAAVLGNVLSLWVVTRIKARRDREGWRSPV
ncbi:MAG: hypothetical protein C4293_10875, partial [Nitrospiraceae bacterium]